MTDYLTRPCPVCGGRLCVDAQYPDRVYCDTCEYTWRDGDETVFAATKGEQHVHESV